MALDPNVERLLDAVDVARERADKLGALLRRAWSLLTVEQRLTISVFTDIDAVLPEKESKGAEAMAVTYPWEDQRDKIKSLVDRAHRLYSDAQYGLLTWHLLEADVLFDLCQLLIESGFGDKNK